MAQEKQSETLPPKLLRMLHFDLDALSSEFSLWDSVALELIRQLYFCEQLVAREDDIVRVASAGGIGLNEMLSSGGAGPSFNLTPSHSVASAPNSWGDAGSDAVSSEDGGGAPPTENEDRARVLFAISRRQLSLVTELCKAVDDARGSSEAILSSYSELMASTQALTSRNAVLEVQL